MAHRTDIPHEPGTLDSCWGCKPPVTVEAVKAEKREFKPGETVYIMGDVKASVVRRKKSFGSWGYDLIQNNDLGELGQYSNFYPDHMVKETRRSQYGR